MGNMRTGLHLHLARLDEIFATRGDYVQTLQFMQQMADNVIKQLLGLPDWDVSKVDLASIADQTANIEYYRWGNVCGKQRDQMFCLLTGLRDAALYKGPISVLRGQI